jgi:hypothetical protein
LGKANPYPVLYNYRLLCVCFIKYKCSVGILYFNVYSVIIANNNTYPLTIHLEK